MIQVTTQRCWLLVVATTVDDNRIPHSALGLTAEGATRRLVRKLA